MINFIFFIIKKFFLYKFYVNYYARTYNFEKFDYNFRNIEFFDTNILKKIFYSDKYLSKQIINEESYDYHSFDWINFSKKIGGVESVRKTKKHILNWVEKKYSKQTIIWNSVFVSKRFINILYNYDFFTISSSKKDKEIINKIIFEHFFFINLYLNRKKAHEINIEEIKAKILGSLIFDQKINKNLDLLHDVISLQINKNGFHKSYSPSNHVDFLNNLVEIKNILLYFKINESKQLNFQILNVSSLLIALTHKNNTLALYNGSNNFYINETKALIHQAKDVKEKNYDLLSEGLLIYGDKNKKIFMDITKPTNKLLNSNIHAGTLSLEISALNEKIITNCGSLEKRIGEKPEYLRYSAAHSTIIINNTNISELKKKKSYKRIPKNLTVKQKKLKDCDIWEVSHDGYINNYKRIVKRVVKINRNKNEFYGEDPIITTKIDSAKVSYSLRFHCTPECNLLITNDNKTIILRTKLNNTWLFKSSAKLKIEDSVYVENGKNIKQNKQIVIYGYSDSKKKVDNWSLCLT